MSDGAPVMVPALLTRRISLLQIGIRRGGIRGLGARATASYTPVPRQDVDDGTSRRPLRRQILGLPSLQDLPCAPAVARVLGETGDP